MLVRPISNFIHSGECCSILIAGNEVIEQQKKRLEQLRSKAAVDAHLSWLNKRQTTLTESVNGDQLSQQLNDLLLPSPSPCPSAQETDLQKELSVAVSPREVPHTCTLSSVSSPLSPEKSETNEATSPSAVFSSDDSSSSSPLQLTDSDIKSVSFIHSFRVPLQETYSKPTQFVLCKHLAYL